MRIHRVEQGDESFGLHPAGEKVPAKEAADAFSTVGRSSVRPATLKARGRTTDRLGITLAREQRLSTAFSVNRKLLRRRPYSKDGPYSEGVMRSAR